MRSTSSLPPHRRLARLACLAAISARPAADTSLCVVIDLGNLCRDASVPRLLGPGFADGLTLAAEAELRRAAGPDTTVWEVDADCYAFLVPDRGRAAWAPMVESLMDRLRQPLEHEGLSGAVAPGAGLVPFRAGAEAEPVLRNAVAAALEARRANLAWCMRPAAGETGYGRLRTLVAGLPAALAAPDQFSLAYQPRIDLRRGRCVSVEALLRWDHPVIGRVPPDEFIPVTEQTGLVRGVTAWVIEHALRDLAGWAAAGGGHGVSINVSASNLVEEDFAARLGASIRACGVDPGRVELEFTESVLVRDSARVRETVAALVRLGVHISIDDFGTGYSNLQYLRDLPAGTLKIDQSFIRTLPHNSRDPVIVQGIIGLAHALGHRVVAEGVESGEAQAMLQGWGCDEVQGYHICRPIPLPAMQAWLMVHDRAR